MEERENDFTPVMAAPAWEDIAVGDIKIRAYFTASRDILFILDMTQDEILPNMLLVLDSRDGRKWDDILPNDFNVDPETIRPRINNKYQKLDIDYESLRYYADAILTGREDTLATVRIGIAERQKEFRMGEAYREIELAEATVMEAKKTVDDLNAFIKLQKEKLRAAKKNLGKEPPKASAAKILRYESRIEKAEAKKSRSMRRIRRAEGRVDAARGLLASYRSILLPRNTEKAAPPQFDISKGIIMNENDVRPLFTENPDIMDNDNAFRPVAFEPVPEPEPRPIAAPLQSAPVVNYAAVPEPAPEPAPQPMPQSMPMPSPSPFVAEAPAPGPVYRPASPMSADVSRPMGPVSGADIKIDAANAGDGRPGGVYYLMLMLLIGLSIFTLYLYQKKMNSDALPHIAAVVPETVEPSKPASAVFSEPEVEPEPEPAAQPEPIPETIPEPELPEIVPEPVADVIAEPSAPADIPAEMPAPALESEPVVDTMAAEPAPEFIEETFEETIEPAEPEPSVEPMPSDAALGMPEPVMEYDEAEVVAEPGAALEAEIIENNQFGEGVEE